MPRCTVPCLVLFLALLGVSTNAFSEPDDAATDKKGPPPIAEVVKRPWGSPTLTSGLGVPAKETFHLGERQTGAFTVSAKNIGEESVLVLCTRGKRREEVGRVEPGDTVVRAFQEGDGVLIQNPSESVNAKLTVEVWGTKNLAMYYVPNKEEPELP